MSTRRLNHRLPAAPLGRATAPGFALHFHKVSDRDGSGKCDIAPGAPADVVHGMLFRIAERDRRRLDRIEGPGYEADQIEVLGADGIRARAWTYRAVVIEPGLRPFCWYHHHVLHGAREARLPHAYVAAAIETVEPLRDPDRQRAARELSIYTASIKPGGDPS